MNEMDYRFEPLELSVDDVVKVGHQTGSPELDGVGIARVGGFQMTLTVDVEVRGQVARVPAASAPSARRIIHRRLSVIQTPFFRKTKLNKYNSNQFSFF